MAKTRNPPKSAEPAEIAQTADLVLLNRKDAATALGLSDRRVHEFGQQGLLTQHEAIDPVTGRKSVMFDQAEVERLAAERATAEDGRRVAAQRRRIAAAQVRSGALVSPATIAPGAIVPAAGGSMDHASGCGRIYRALDTPARAPDCRGHSAGARRRKITWRLGPVARQTGRARRLDGRVPFHPECVKYSVRPRKWGKIAAFGCQDLEVTNRARRTRWSGTDRPAGNSAGACRANDVRYDWRLRFH